MKLTITTTYEGFDQEWLDYWYLNRIEDSTLPGSAIIVEEIQQCGHAVYASKDPTSNCTAKTEYVLETKPPEGSEE